MGVFQDELKKRGIDFNSFQLAIRRRKYDALKKYEEPLEQLTMSDLIKLSTIVGVSLDEMALWMREDSPVASITEERFNKAVASKGDSQLGRMNLIKDLCSLSELDIPAMLFSIVVNGEEKEKKEKEYIPIGMPLERVEFLKEKYKDYYVPVYSNQEIQDWCLAKMPSRLVAEKHRERWALLRKQGVHLKKPLPLNHPSRGGK